MREFAILVGDVRARLRDLPDACVQACIVSPPYYNLRDYGIEGQIGAESRPDCLAWARGSRDPFIAYDDDGEPFIDYRPIGQVSTCGECFVCTLVEVFRGVRRVLRDDGTLWLNLGDSYAQTSLGAGGKGKQSRNAGSVQMRGIKKTMTIPDGLKQKDLIGVPWRVALALQADGWYLRSDVVWHKPNPMPESVTDRPTKSHEYVFMLTKSERYFFDAEAVREPHARLWDSTNGGGNLSSDGLHKANGKIRERGGKYPTPDPSGRNVRSVWTITTKPFAGAHFATFPEDLPLRCIKASTSAGGQCSSCGTPFERYIERGAPNTEQQRASGGDINGEYHGDATKAFEGTGAQNASDVKRRILAGMVEKITRGWLPACDCHGRQFSRGGVPRRQTRITGRWRRLARRVAAMPAPAPCVVLDPFNGAGTTGVAALGLDRRYVGVELNPQFAAMTVERLKAAGPLLVRERALEDLVGRVGNLGDDMKESSDDDEEIVSVGRSA